MTIFQIIDCNTKGTFPSFSVDISQSFLCNAAVIQYISIKLWECLLDWASQKIQAVKFIFSIWFLYSLIVNWWSNRKNSNKLLSAHGFMCSPDSFLTQGHNIFISWGKIPLTVWNSGENIISLFFHRQTLVSRLSKMLKWI